MNPQWHHGPYSENYYHNEYYNDYYYDEYYEENYFWPEPQNHENMHQFGQHHQPPPPPPPTAHSTRPSPDVDPVDKELDEQLAKQRESEKESTKKLLTRAAEVYKIRPEDGFAEAKAIYMMRSGQLPSLTAIADVEDEIDDF